MLKSLILILAFALTAKAEVIETNRYADVLPYLTSDTLFVTDLDNTVLRPPQTLGSDQWGGALQADLVARGYSKDQATDLGVSLFALVQMKTTVVPVEATTPALLKTIALRGIPTLGLTARPLAIVERTIAQLKSIGVELTGAPLSSANDSTLALRQGVLFVGAHNNKGEVLKRVFDQAPSMRFKRIVFIDDKLHHAQAVDSAFAGTGIEVKSFRYGATDALVKSYDAKIGQNEFEIFNRTGRIVSDEESAQNTSPGHF